MADTEMILASKLKARVALEALRGDRSAAEIAFDYGISAGEVIEWARELQHNAEAIFRPAGAPGASAPVPTAEEASRGEAETVRFAPSPFPPPVAAPAPTFPLPPDGEDPPTIPEWPSGPKPAEALSAAAGDAPEDEDWGEESDALAAPPSAKDASPAPGPRNGLQRALDSMVLGWKERRQATKSSLEMLELHRSVAGLRPDLGGPELYALIVMARLRTSQAQAEEILVRATESFAAWPVKRPLTFRDVVHYVAVSEYLAKNEEFVHGTRENFGRIVSRLVPHDL